MAVDDRIDLVGAHRRLVDPLRVNRYSAFGAGEPGIEPSEAGRRQIGDGRSRGQCRHRMPRRLDCRRKPGGAMFDPSVVTQTVIDEVQQEPGKDRDIGTGPKCQMKVGNVTSRRPAGVDDDDARPTRGSSGGKALV